MKPTPESSGRICIFASTPPAPGEARPRLNAAVGDRAAERLARAFLADTCASVLTLGWGRPVVAATGPVEVPSGVEVWPLGEGDQATRIERILRQALADAPFAIALEADAPAIPAQLLRETRELLVKTEAVLGPATDGGIYLMGLRRCPAGLLAGLPWRTQDTFARARERMEAHGMYARILDAWFEVDCPEDLDRLRRALARGQIYAPETERELLAVSR